jgi:hypothetical protein
MAAAPGAHARQDRARHIGQPPEIDLEHAANFVVVAFLDGGEIADAGIVDEDVDAAKLGLSRRDARRDLGGLGHIERQDERVALMARRQIGDVLGISRGDDDPVAAIQRIARELAAKAGRAARDEPNRLVLPCHCRLL